MIGILITHVASFGTDYLSLCKAGAFFFSRIIQQSCPLCFDLDSSVSVPRHLTPACTFRASIFTCAHVNTGLRLPFGVIIVCRPRLSSRVSVLLAWVSASRSWWDWERSKLRRLLFHMSTGHKHPLMTQNN